MVRLPKPVLPTAFQASLSFSQPPTARVVVPAGSPGSELTSKKSDAFGAPACAWAMSVR